jgi:hypothetical protein
MRSSAKWIKGRRLVVSLLVFIAVIAMMRRHGAVVQQCMSGRHGHRSSMTCDPAVETPRQECACGGPAREECEELRQPLQAA